MNISKSNAKQKISRPAQNNQTSVNAEKCRRKFLRFFPQGFQDEKYVAWERGYKWQAHEKWNAQLNSAEYQSLLRKGTGDNQSARNYWSFNRRRCRVSGVA